MSFKLAHFGRGCLKPLLHSVIEIQSSDNFFVRWGEVVYSGRSLQKTPPSPHG